MVFLPSHHRSGAFPAGVRRRRALAGALPIGRGNQTLVKGSNVSRCDRSVWARLLFGLGVVAAMSLFFLQATTVKAAEDSSNGSGDSYRCKAAVSGRAGGYRDHFVACYFDVAQFVEVPGEYAITGDVTTPGFSYAAAFMWRNGGGYHWCGGKNGNGGTLWVGPTTTSQTVLGRHLFAGQMVYVHESRQEAGSCMTGAPNDGHAAAAGCQVNSIGSPTDSLTIEVTAAGISITSPNHPYSRCSTGNTIAAEWAGKQGNFGADWFDEWLDTETAWPESWYPGGVSGIIPTSACGQIVVEYELNGVMLGGAGPFVSDAVVIPGDEVIIHADFDTVNFPDESPSTVLLSARVRPNNGMGAGAWTSIAESALPVGGGGYWEIDVSDLYTKSHPLALFELRCSDTEGHSYYVQNGDHLWTDDAAEHRACSALTLFYPDQSTVHAGDVVRIGFRMEPGPFALADNGIVRLQSYETTSTSFVDNLTDVGETFDRFGNKVGEYPEVTYPFHIPDDVLGYFDVTVQFDELETSDLHFRCTDTVGTVDSDGDGVFDCDTCGIGSTPDPESLSDCFGATGLSLSPSSWVPGLVSMQACTVRVLVVPSPGFVEEWADDQRTTLEDVPPFSFGLALVDFGVDLSDEVASPSGDGCFDVGIPVPGSGSSEMCVGADVSTTGGQRSVIAMFIIVPIVLALLARGFTLLRSS